MSTTDVTRQEDVTTTATWRADLERLASVKTPSFVHLRTPLPKQGRTNKVVLATPNLSVVLKTYASGGENALHAHPNEDHLFVILQGAATFYGPRDESKHVAKNDCVMIPRGSHYWFEADEGSDALVLLRVGAVVDATKDVMERIDIDGKPFDGQDEKNHEVPLILHENKFFE